MSARSPIGGPPRLPVAAAAVIAAAGAAALALAVGDALSPAAAGALAAGAAAAALVLIGDEAARRARRPRAAAAPAPPPPPSAPDPAKSPAGAALQADIVEQLPDPVLMIRKDGRVHAANARARAIMDLSRPHVLLSSVLREPEVLEAVQDAQRGGDPVEATYRTSGPRERFMRAFVSQLPDAEGQGKGLTMVVLHDETAVRVAERSRVSFLANASHELRTPLASLSGFIETLRGHAKDDPVAREQFLEIMQAQADRMRRLIDDLLSLSRAEQNEHVPPTGVADLGALANDVIDALGPVAREQDVTVTIHRDAPRTPVLGDRDELVQVVQNLVENAIKYGGRGGAVEVEVGAGLERERATQPKSPQHADATRLSLLTPRDTGGGAFAWVAVRDAGPGIAREHLPRLCERFFRAPRTGGAEPNGTGLGLAIVRHLINRHRGGLAVESAVGKGTTFEVYIPHTPEFSATSASGDTDSPQAAVVTQPSLY